MIRSALCSKACLALLLTLCLWSAAVQASEASLTPTQLIQNMLTAMKMGNYQGRYVYFDSNDMRSVSIKYAYLDGVAHERVMHLEGMHSEIIRIGGQVVCLHEGKPINQFEQPDFSGDRAFLNLSPRALKNYEISLAEPTRVAGRQAVGINLTPKDEYRYGYRVWIDSDSYHLLKLELGSKQQSALEVFEFVDLEQTAGLTHDDFMVMGAAGDPGHPMMDLSQASKAHTMRASERTLRWQAPWLPPGFEPRAYTQPLRSLKAPDGVLDMRTYSDGLSSFTLFISEFDPKIKQTSDSVRRLQRGATIMISRPVAAGLLGPEAYRLTFVGELPLEGAEKILARLLSPTDRR